MGIWAGLGAYGVSYWCRCPQVPDAWRKRTGRRFALHGSQAVVLTTPEIDARLGSESVAGLSQRIERLWGGILRESVFASELFQEWLSYFIKHNHDFGIVHVWVSALREWLRRHWSTVPSMPMELGLEGPSAYVGNEDGELLAGLVAPVLDRRMTILDGNPVISPGGDQRPRRIWGVWANRVVPTAWFPRPFLDDVNLVVISHAWVASTERKYVMMDVNCRTWPIPMLRDVEIKDIRQGCYDAIFALLGLISFVSARIWLRISCPGISSRILPQLLCEGCYRSRSGPQMCHSLGQYTGVK